MINKYSFLFLILFLFFTLPTHSAEVNISVNKKTLSQADTLQLTIDYNGDENEKPDLDILSQDFQILSNSSSKQITFINGQLNQLQKWTLTLKPKKTGKITIKPVKIGDISSNYETITVKDVTDVAFIPDSQENSNAPYFQIEKKFFPQTPYIQQQVTFLVTIYDSLGLQNGTISIDNDPKQWVLTSLSDKPIVKQEKIKGKYMNVVTFAFAAFPQKSGQLQLPRFSFNGYYLKDTKIDLPDFDDFMNFGFNLGKAFGEKVPVNMKTKEEMVTILSVPDNFSAKIWLPLKDFQITSSWGNKNNIKVNEAVNRNITFTATGIEKNMVPTLDFPVVKGLKQYPEKPEISEKVVQGDIVSSSSINIVYIPTKSGKIILPPLNIEWFNVDTNKIETTTLPEETIFVDNGASHFETMKNNTIETTSSTLDSNDNSISIDLPKTDKEKSTPSSHPKYFSSFFTPLYLIASGIFLVLLTLIIYLLLRKEKNPYYSLVIKSIKKHDYKATRDNLIEWAKIKYSNSNIQNINMIIQLSHNEDFSKQLNSLNKLMYSSSDINFSGSKFIEIFKKVDKLKYNIKKKNKILPNLYD